MDKKTATTITGYIGFRVKGLGLKRCLAFSSQAKECSSLGYLDQGKLANSKTNVTSFRHEIYVLPCADNLALPIF